MSQRFTIVIFTENNVSLIVRLATMISRRLIRISSLEVYSYEVEGLYRFTIVVNEAEDTVRKLMLQIDKQVEVYKSFFNTDGAFVSEQQESYFRSNLAQANEVIINQLREESIV